MDYHFLLTRLLAAAAVATTVTALRHAQEAVTSFLVAVVWVLVLFAMGRVVTMQIVLFGRRGRQVTHRTRLVGGRASSAELATIIERYPHYGLTIVGFVDDEPDLNPVGNVSWLGHLRDLDALASNHKIDTVLVGRRIGSNEKLLDVLLPAIGA
jgi:FlaA1/EpsC-like NDP-sugar epimerase